MHSFKYLSFGVVIVGVSASPIDAPTPATTPSPTLARKDLTDSIDAVSFAKILLTAVPQSLREIAATNIPAVSSILWSEFLDDKKPEWFKALPTDVQSYLVHEFGPKTASASPTGESSAPTASSASSASSAATLSSPSATASVSGSSTLATSIVPSSRSQTETQSKGSALSTQKAAPTASNTSSTSSTSSATPASGGLSHSQKIGVGVGVPFAALGAAALGLGCCFLLRRRRKSRKEGSVPPSSPGFIPRFAFQEKNNSDRALHQPLHSKNDNTSYSAADMGAMGWDEDIVNDDRHRYPKPSPPVPAPVIKPGIFHTHSSNRARGTRTSYTSLHSVPEERERENDDRHIAAVPTSPTSPVSPIMKKTPQQSRRSLITSPGPAGSPLRSQVKRKPVSREVDLGSLGLSSNGPASQSLLQRQHDGYDSGYGSNSTQEHLNNPKSNANPFSNDYSYVEDYGAEYHHGYNDSEQAWFANQPPSQTERRVYSKTEWPLRNVRGHQRNRSPMWDRVYEG